MRTIKVSDKTYKLIREFAERYNLTISKATSIIIEKGLNKVTKSDFDDIDELANRIAEKVSYDLIARIEYFLKR